MTTSTTTADVTTSSSVASPSPVELRETDRPSVVGRRAGRLVALVVGLALVLSVGAAAVIWTSGHRGAALAVPVLAADAPAVVGDAAHGGPGSWADTVRPAIPPREDDRAVLAHGGAGRVVTGTGTPHPQLP